MTRHLLMAVGAMAAIACHAESKTCLVVGITDGDTLTARCGQRGAYELVKVRISAIDAPEKNQPFGAESKRNLSALCYKAEATITAKTLDRHGRTVADVKCGQHDVATEQVRAGMAWVYDKYAKGYEWLYPLQEASRTSMTGLWGASSPHTPWKWRHEQRDDIR